MCKKEVHVHVHEHLMVGPCRQASNSSSLLALISREYANLSGAHTKFVYMYIPVHLHVPNLPESTLMHTTDNEIYIQYTHVHERTFLSIDSSDDSDEACPDTSWMASA